MAAFARPIRVSVWDSNRELLFSDSAEMRAWATKELAFWDIPTNELNQNIRSYYEQQRALFQNLVNLIVTFEGASEQQRPAAENQLDSLLKPLASGAILTTECRQFKGLTRLKKHDLNGFAILAIASRSNGRDIISSIDQATVTTHLAKAALVTNRPDADSAPYRIELAELKNSYERDLAIIREQLKGFNSDRENASKAEEIAFNQRQEAWSEQTAGFDKEWAEMKRIYEVKMALAAPATYWNKRAQGSQTQAIGLSIAFGIVASAALILFFYLAVPHLAGVTKDASPFIALLPVIAPAFLAIWILKILGRHLSESIQLIRDARERETMVTTFLALMNDQSTGRTLVKDEDRALILQALFRQSSITVSDDAPPVHWAEILKKR